MKLVVDGVFFQLAGGGIGISRVWSSLLPRLAARQDLEITLLDRGNSPSFDKIEKLNFPRYTILANTAADSFLIDRVCREVGAEVFISTYYTTPVTIPSVLMVYDMIPEVLGFDLRRRDWQEKQIAIAFASYYACISETTRSDLMRFYPTIGYDRAQITHCAVEHHVFRPRDEAQVEDFKRKLGIAKPYFLLVGSREQYQGYKNGSLVFTAMEDFGNLPTEILCVGGEPEIRPDDLARLPSNISARRVDLTDDELACAYSGADAMIHPSLYEGFGMPVIEAMACGCPVITTMHGALGEISGEAALFVTGHDASELRRAMKLVREPSHRKGSVMKGLQRAALYNWDAAALGLCDLLSKSVKERNTPSMQSFLHEWKRLRTIQAEVDVAI
jgi:glycosyltransferase involved in cell wall biosynthesis